MDHHRLIMLLCAVMTSLWLVVLAQDTLTDLPCITRLHQLYCRNTSKSYPELQIQQFITLHMALTRRMFGEYSPPGDLFEEVPAFPDIQQFNTVNFPEHLRPKDDPSIIGLASSFESEAPSVLRRSRTRSSRTRSSRAGSSRSNRTVSAVASTRQRIGNRSLFASKRISSVRRNHKRGASGLNGTVLAMTPVRSRKQGSTRIPEVRPSARRPGSRVYPNNVFLNNATELEASASQSDQRARLAQARATNQRSTDLRPKRAAKRRTSSRRPPKIGKTSKHLVDSCESQLEVTTPRWAANSAGKILAIVNTEHFPQAIHQETCKGTTTRHCRGECTCEQKYAYHRLLAYDPKNECKGIFIDWFLFPSCCVCRCPP